MSNFKNHKPTEQKKKSCNDEIINSSKQDPLFTMFGSIHASEPLTNAQIDEIIYGDEEKCF